MLATRKATDASRCNHCSLLTDAAAQVRCGGSGRNLADFVESNNKAMRSGLRYFCAKSKKWFFSLFLPCSGKGKTSLSAAGPISG